MHMRYLSSNFFLFLRKLHFLHVYQLQLCSYVRVISQLLLLLLLLLLRMQLMTVTQLHLSVAEHLCQLLHLLLLTGKCHHVSHVAARLYTVDWRKVLLLVLLLL